MTNPFVKNNHTESRRTGARYFIDKTRLLLLGSLLFITFWSVGQSATQPGPIALHAHPQVFIPKEFYFADVIDERSRQDRKAVAHLLPVSTNSASGSVATPVDLQGGGLQAIRQFVRQSVPRNTKLRPVIIRLKECRITETPGLKGRVVGQVVVSMAFDFQRDGETIHLVEYTGGGARYDRPVGKLTAVEQALRQSLVSGLNYFDTWINQEASTNEKLARSLQVFFTDYTENVQADTVFYTSSRPLVWDDFREKPRVSRYAASIFPSFAYEGRSHMVNGVIHLNVLMKVYMLKKASWVKEGAKDEYGLNHEQRHFDIVKLVAERFKQKIQPDSLTIEDYNSIMQYHYLESYREMNRLQEQYDQETQHGLDHAAQEHWNRRIDQELNGLSVKEGS